MTQTTTDTTAARVLAAIRARGVELTETGTGKHRGNSPLREGSDSECFSLEVDPGGEHGKWYDHVRNEGGSLYELAGLLGVDPPQQEPNTYDYHDEAGTLVFQVVRKPGKKFLQRRPVGDGWEWSVKGIKKPPYNLPEIIKYPDAKIYIVEGEKDAEALRGATQVATTNAGGAGNWPKNVDSSYYKHFDGRRVVIIPDNDESGHKHALEVASRLHRCAASIKILPPLGEAKGYDISDWFKDGGNTTKLFELEKATPEWEPAFKDSASYQNGSTMAEPTLTAEGFKEVTNATWADLEDILGPVEWIWQDWLPLGFLTLIAALSGDGKSYYALRVAGSFIAGWDLPDGTPFKGETGKVLWCEAEAAQALNLERAKAMNLPTSSFVIPFGKDKALDSVELDNPEHQAAIRATAARDDVKCIIVDSLSGATTKRDTKASNEMLAIGKWLAELSRDLNKPVIVTHHLRKKNAFDGEQITLDRLRDSSAISQTARVIWGIDAPDYQFQEQKRVYVIKSNLAKFPDPIGFTIGAAGVKSLDFVPEVPREESQKDKAVDLLLTILKPGPMSAKDIEDEAMGIGVSMETIRRAKKALNIVSIKDTEGWKWSLPARL